MQLILLLFLRFPIGWQEPSGDLQFAMLSLFSARYKFGSLFPCGQRSAIDFLFVSIPIALPPVDSTAEESCVFSTCFSASV